MVLMGVGGGGRQSMKKLSVVFGLTVLALASVALAAVEIQFHDGSSMIWEDYYVKYNSYCTRKAGNIEFCVPKSDVKKIVKAADDAESEYGASGGGGSGGSGGKAQGSASQGGQASEGKSSGNATEKVKEPLKSIKHLGM